MSRTPTAQHGTRGCYLRGCKRAECRDANYQYMSRIRLDYHRGQRRRIDVQPVLDHIRRFIDAGWTQAQIERASGVSHNSLGNLLRGKQSSINTTNARLLLALTLTPPPDDVRDVDATGTIRRIRALFAIGYTLVELAPRIGLHESPLSVIARGERPTVRVVTAEATKTAYRKLSRTPGTSKRSRNVAAQRGWHGPLAWDENTIDDPNAKPETDGPETELNRIELGALRREEIEHLASFGRPSIEIAQRLGMQPAYVHDLIVVIRNGQRRDRTAVAA